MVARIVTGKSLKGVLHYNEHKLREGQAELILAHRFLHTPAALSFTDKLQRFQQLLEKSPRVKTNAVHISLNFEASEKLETGTLQQIASAYMDRIGFGGQPYLVYRHLDAAHPHMHIVSTNIRPDGSRIDLHNIGREKSEPVRKALELEFALVQAESRKQVQQLPLSPQKLQGAVYGQTETKRAIAAIVSEVTQRYNYTSLPELNAVLRRFGVTADRGHEDTRMYRKKGLVYSLLDKKGQKRGVPLKASALPGKPTLARLEKRFEENKVHRPLYRAALRHTLNKVLRHAPAGPDAFARLLAREKIEVVFHQNSQGLAYGVSFIDHHRRAVFKGSELGKAYGARALTDLFTRNETKLKTEKQLFSRQPEKAAERQLPKESAAPRFSTNAGTGMLDALLRPGWQGEPLSRELQQKKRKRKKRRLHL